MDLQIENLNAKLAGHKLNIYQKADAKKELNKLIEYVNELETKVENLGLFDVRLSCFKEVFEKFQEIQEESEFYGWLHSKAHEA